MSEPNVSNRAREAAANYMAAVSAKMGEYNPVSLAFLDEACDDLPITQAFAAFERAILAQVRERVAEIRRHKTSRDGFYIDTVEQALSEALSAIDAVGGEVKG